MKHAMISGMAVVTALTCTAALAQPREAGKMARVGILASGGPNFDAGIAPFRERLRALGYVEGRNLALIIRNAEGRAERQRELAEELVALPADVVVAQGNPAVIALRQVTTSVPVVMASVADPVGAGYIVSLAKPGGNITGLANLSEGLSPKWVELMKQVVPAMTRIAVMADLRLAPHQVMWRDMQAASRELGLSARAWEVRAPDDIEPAFAAMKGERSEALVILPHPMFNVHRRRIADLALRQGLPALYPFREFVEAGSLLSYGPSVADLWIQAAGYVDRILKGARPMDLPVAQPTKFVLSINAKTAKALNIAIPQRLLLQADEVLQ